MNWSSFLSALNVTNVCIKHQPCFAWTSELSSSQVRLSKYKAFKYHLSHLVSFCRLSQNSPDTYRRILLIYCPCENTHCTFKMNRCGYDPQSVEELICLGIHHQQTCVCAARFDQCHHLRVTQALDACVVHLQTWQTEERADFDWILTIAHFLYHIDRKITIQALNEPQCIQLKLHLN